MGKTDGKDPAPAESTSLVFHSCLLDVAKKKRPTGSTSN